MKYVGHFSIRKRFAIFDANPELRLTLIYLNDNRYNDNFILFAPINVWKIQPILRLLNV